MYSVTLKDRPSLSAQLVENGRLWTLKGTASAGGLMASQQMQVLGYAVPKGGGDPKRIFFVTTGPNSDGMASETFEAPVPKGRYKSIVVTANHGILPRDCAGNRAWYVASDPVKLKEAPEFEEDLQNACVTLAPPPTIPAQ